MKGQKMNKVTIDLDTITSEMDTLKQNKARLQFDLKEVEKEIREKILDWLRLGLDVFPDMQPEIVLQDEFDHINFFDTYFENSAREDIDFFLDTMQRNMHVLFGNYSEPLVSKIGGELLYQLNYTDLEIGKDFENLFDAWPQYVQAMSEAEQVDEQEDKDPNVL